MLKTIPDSEWPTAIASMRGGFATKLDVYRVMAHNSALLKSWEDFRNHLVLDNALPEHALEIVILRTSHRHNAPYEWAHHVVRGRKAGLSEAQIAACSGPAEECTDPLDRLLIEAVDYLIDQSRIPHSILAEVAEHFGKEAILDIMGLVGMYTTLAYIVNSFDIPVDQDIARELAQNPPPAIG
jgi:alkylhydroperoxidase family enzyme